LEYEPWIDPPPADRWEREDREEEEERLGEDGSRFVFLSISDEGGGLYDDN
jgi:hypothetical protein